MRFLVQRVRHASVSVDGSVVGSIGRGYMVLIGIADTDTTALADRMLTKLINLRICEDSEGKANLSLADTKGELLLISQFTLYADMRRGNRPSFIRAGKPDAAAKLYEYIISRAKESVPVTERGIFGADMKVELLNDGPFTVMMDSEELFPVKQ